jgi:hypothetical protein
MFARTIPFNEMQGQRRWKVEFFCADRDNARSTTYPLVQLKEVLTERRESLDPQQHAEHTFNYLGLEHVESLTGDLVDSYAPRTGKEVLSRCKVFRQGDVLYGRLRPVLNKVFAADEFLPEGICSGEFYVLIPELDRLLPCFARAVLASRYVQDIVKSMTTGSALPRLQLEDLLEVEVPLPPLKVQKLFEQKIRQQNSRRRSLRSEVTLGPAAMLDSLIESLESGANFDFDLSALGSVNGFADIPLPKVQASNGRRGRPGKNDHKQLKIKLAE